MIATEPTQTADLRPEQAPGAPLYELSRLERTFSKGSLTVHAIRGVDLVIDRGEMLSLEGPSGSGKSTLLQLLGALDSPTGGSIRFAGRDLAGLSDKELTRIRAREIGFVFQHFNLIPTLTAMENIAVAMFPNHVRPHERRGRAEDLLNQVGLAHRLHQLPSRLSGGEQQRVAIARALANNPSVIIADEPTGNLDSATAKEVMAVLSSLHASAGVTIVIATHDEEVAQLTSRRVRIRDGAILEDSAP
ncbi:MAG: ABC transporter ATP-binding protein [Acidimicrobiales bacterium]|jgi:putative ABC transport system ATP-binding protein